MYPIEPDAVHEMGVSRSTIFALIASGELASVKVGTRRLIAHSDIVDYIKRHRSNENAAGPRLLAGLKEDRSGAANLQP
jgi:excisionase family DNA binding protein